MTGSSPNPIDPQLALDGFWDAVVERLPADSIRIPAADVLDASTIRRMHALVPDVTPGAAFSDRLLTSLLDQLAAHPPSLVKSLSPDPQREQPTMHAIALDRPIDYQRPPSRRRKPWTARLELAAALLLIFGLAALAIRQLPGGMPEPVTSIPAVVQTDNATPLPASSDVPMYRGDVGRTGQMAGPGPSGTPIELWQTHTGGTIESSSVVVDGTIVIGSNDGKLYALDASTGDQRWAFTASSPVSGSPAIVDGVVYVGSRDGIVYAIDFATGSQIWAFAGTREGSSPLVVDGSVFVGSWEGNTLYALDAQTGTQRWTLEAAAPFIRTGAYADGIVYYPSREGVLHAVDAATGAERWTFTMDTPVDVDSPVVLNGVVYQPTYQAGSTVYAIETATGNELWRYSQPQGFRSPAVDAQTLYLPGMSGNVTAVDVQNGDVRWTVELGAPIMAAPSLSNGVLYVAAQDSTLYGLDAATGAERWNFVVDQSIDRNPTVAGGAVYVGTLGGTIYAIGDAPDGAAATASTISASATEGTPASTFDQSEIQVVWQSTGGPVAFDTPGGMALAPNGDLFVGDNRNNVVQIINPHDGSYVDLVEDSTGAPIRFGFTGNSGYDASLGFDTDGNLYVFDFNNNRVQKLDPQHALLLEWGSTGEGNGQFQLPKGFVDAANDRIYVADIVNNRVQVFDLDGDFLDKWGGFGTLSGQFNEPNSVTVGPDGTIYVSEYSGGRIQKFDSNGVYLGTIGEPGSEPGQLNQPTGIAIDADGNVVVADFANGRLQIFRPDGSLIGIVTAIPGYADHIAPSFVMFDHDGYLLMSDEAGNSVVKMKLPPLS